MSDLDQLPPTWLQAKLGEVCTHPQYGFTTKATDSGTLKFLRTTDITSGEIDWDSVPYCRDEPDSLAEYLLQDGDVVISRAGSVGFSYLLRKPQRSIFASYLIRFRPLIDAKFFAYFLQSPVYWREIAASKVGIAVGNVSASKLREIPFPLAPLHEQHRIVAKIEELFSELDKGIDNLKLARVQLAVYRQALLKHAFEGKLTANWRAANGHQGPAANEYLRLLKERKSSKPKFVSERSHEIESWAFATLDELTGHITSGSRGWADFYSESGSLFIRAQNIKRDVLDLTDIAFVKPPTGSEGTRTQTRNGDIFITITGANVTKAGFQKGDIGEAFVSQHVALCRPLDSSLSEYLHLYIISSGGGRRDLERAAYGAGKPGLNLDNVRSLEIPVPSPDEITILVAQTRAALAAAEAIEIEIETNLRKSEALRHSILTRAFAGKLLPQNPDDEPADALLARMRAERAVVGSTKAKSSKKLRVAQA